MKKLIFIFFFPYFVHGQGAYLELNAGFANIPENGGSAISLFPGASFLLGKRFEPSDGNLILDMEIGLAFPTIVTGKIGGGIFIDRRLKSAILVGIRPWPLHLYTQVNLAERPKGQFILSLEAGSALFDERIGNIYFDELSAYSTFILNIGYRWNIGKNE